MNLFFKKKKTVIDCFTSNVNALELFPVQESKNFYPDWWKELPKTESAENSSGMLIDKSTIKRCEGLIRLYQTGFIIPLWSDVSIQTQAINYLYEFADGVSSLTYHASEQLGVDFRNYLHVKFESPWRIQEKSGVDFVFVQPSWNNPADLIACHTPPGVIDFKYQHTSSINMFLLRSRRYNWQAGRPLAQLIPVSDNEIDIRCHLVTDQELSTMRVMNRSMPFFQNSYRKYKKLKDTCPVTGRKNES